MKEEKRQFTVLLPLGDLAYDEDFLQKAKKIKGIKEIWPVIEVPVSSKLKIIRKQRLFQGIDMKCVWQKNPTQNELGRCRWYCWEMVPYGNMKDYNNHAISKKQQEKFLEMGENLNIFIPWMKKRRILPKPRMILPLYPAIPQENRKPHICPVKPL